MKNPRLKEFMCFAHDPYCRGQNVFKPKLQLLTTQPSVPVSPLHLSLSNLPTNIKTVNYLIKKLHVDRTIIYEFATLSVAMTQVKVVISSPGRGTFSSRDTYSPIWKENIHILIPECLYCYSTQLFLTYLHRRHW